MNAFASPLPARTASFRSGRARRARGSPVWPRLLAGLAVPAWFAAGGFAAEVDTSKLPAPARGEVDFEREIKPILEVSCLKCHGLEKPKSKFQLLSRETALKGGDNGVAIVPGKSAESPLIHYVAYLVEDFEMPPVGKGDPLTSNQIALLRAWIDQGVVWPESAVEKPPPLQFTIVPTLQWISVSGDEHKFREHNWTPDQWAGGLQSFTFQQRLGTDGRILADGSALIGPDRVRLRLGVEKDDLGFLRGGYEQFRKYYDDSGGFYAPYPATPLELDRDLHLDTGRAWFDLGLTLPHWPRLILGYEYRFRDGDKSTLQWGEAGFTDAATRNIYPGYKAVDEQIHFIKFDATHEIAGFSLEDNVRIEFYDLRTSRQNASFYNLTTANLDKWVVTRETHDHLQGANTFRLEKQLRDDLLLTAGYHYSRLDGEATFSQRTLLSPTAAVGFVRNDNFWFADRILLKQDTHAFNLNAQFEPWQDLTLAAGVQSQWLRQEAFGNVRLDEGIPGAIIADPATHRADIDRAAVDETLNLRYNGIPFTVLFAEVRLQQESIGHFEAASGSHHEFLRDTDATSELQDYRAGFNVSPWRAFAWNAHYRRRARQTAYDHRRDEAFGLPNDGYSAFIRARDLNTDEIETKLVWKTTSWWKTTLSYRWTGTEYWTATDPYILPEVIIDGTVLPEEILAPGGSIFAGNYDAHIYSLSATLTPWQRWHWTTTVSYRDSRTTTAQNDHPAVVTYDGDVLSVVLSSTYLLNERTDLTGAYTFSRANYRQELAAAGLPLGIEYDMHHFQVGVTRRLKKYFTTHLQYAFFHYDEPSGGGGNDYTAHGVFGSLAMSWP